ncbi:MAG: PAS domain S-box protein [Proteobacteria bacterium]|nr:MAG: PAS domain S-box protein [Pseudomonadota bacterium]QKK10790.1 MAG: PhnD/SsuA/transferrin family substrate-binding protein [Pseudomonadota bacterium]
MIGLRAWIAVFVLLGGTAVSAAEQLVSIGILTHRGKEPTLAAWAPTAQYLSEQVPGHRFVVTPLGFDDVDPAVAALAVDFILANSGMYVDLEVRHGVSRIATLYNRRSDNQRYNVFGGVVFTRADRSDLEGLKELRGSRFAAVHPISLGGYQMSLRELHALGIDPQEDFQVLDFLDVHDRVVRGVLDGTYDAGTVRTDILERMVLDGKIEEKQYRVINPQPYSEDFPFVRSTRLYPEWPFAKARHTSNELAQKVAVALLSMPRDHPAALAGRYAGWTVPLDYQPVHELFKELNLGPYATLERVTPEAVWRKYWYWIVAAMLLLLAAVSIATWIMRLNRELERAKAGLERRHESILSSVGEGVYGVDLEGRSTFVNPAMERLTGWSAEELIGQKQHDLLHHTKADGSAHPREECPVYLTMRDGRQRQVEDIFWRKEGTSFPVEFTSAPVKDLKGKIVGSVVVFRDITERREAEAAERNRQTEIAHAARLSTMGEMATGIAHEVNQPLSAIANYTAACIRMLNSEEYSRESLLQAMQLTARQARRAGEIIRRIRAYIRKAGPAPKPVDINALVREVVGLLTPDSQRQGIVIDLMLDPGLPRVPAHAIEIEQVTLNLARNAIDAMAGAEQDPMILTISTLMGGDREVEVRVSDCGVGFHGSDSEAVFTPFFTTKSSGMGLGLSISRRIVESHGGRLWATANEDRGATFHFSLPLREQVAA